MMNRRHFLKHAAGAAGVALPGMQFLQGLRAAAPEAVCAPATGCRAPRARV